MANPRNLIVHPGPTGQAATLGPPNPSNPDPPTDIKLLDPLNGEEFTITREELARIPTVPNAPPPPVPPEALTQDLTPARSPEEQEGEA